MIESLQNEKIKHLTRLLTDNRFRKKSGTFAVEGKQENERARKFGYEPVEYFLCESIFDEDFPAGKISLVSEKVYEKVAYRGSSEGIIGIYNTKSFNLNAFAIKEDSSVIIIESVEKPGNLGAVLRSCEAFGIDALIITDPKVDFYNPNVIRSSVGCLFGMDIFQSENNALLDFLESNHFKIFTTRMSDDATDIFNQDFGGRSALVFGTEHSGLSDFWIGKGTNTLVPMTGSIDSLNLSNAVAVSGYEILRQKLQKST
ncbi:putative rRNA methylase [Flavobacteriaceae bacterium 3519-10]|nr:putative rRNA methylase [Flavobacteriaceae bacterium 3519-10]